jgi:glycerol-3-phosphate dehydrogenase
MYDIVVIGAGVTGTCIARELSKYKANVCVIEKGDDVAMGTSKANTGVIHTGQEAATGSLMAKLCLEGNRMLYELSPILDFPVEKNGKLIVCTHEEDLPLLHQQYEQGVRNGVQGLEIINRDELLSREPNITRKALAALWLPTGGIIDPFNLAIAMGENANVNGVKFKFETAAKNIEKHDGYYRIKTNRGDIDTKAIANAAGVYADVFHNMVSQDKIHITPRKGEYILFDKSVGKIFNTTVVPLPGKMGKGIAASYTIHGNFFVGPTANDVDDKDDLSTTQSIIDQLKSIAESPNYLHRYPLPLNKIITTFSGARPHEDHHEFIVKELDDAKWFFDAAGIESPGLTSSPAIGRMLSQIIAESMHLKLKENFIAQRIGVKHFKELSEKEQNELIKKDPRYGNIVCRCEMITEGEIVDAINRPIGAKSMDAVKRRTRAGMGRCQAGFCTPRQIEIIARENGIDMTNVTKKGGKSFMLTGRVKEQ